MTHLPLSTGSTEGGVGVPSRLSVSYNYYIVSQCIATRDGFRCNEASLYLNTGTNNIFGYKICGTGNRHDRKPFRAPLYRACLSVSERRIALHALLAVGS